MDLGHFGPLAVLVGVVLGPLALEYGDLRRSSGLGRTGALLTIALLLPSLAVGLAAGFAFSSAPALQWSVTVAITLVVYSLAARGVVVATAPAAARARR